jgi:hypothetical protein
MTDQVPWGGAETARRLKAARSVAPADEDLIARPGAASR